MKTASVYCEFREGFYWHAQAYNFGGKDYESTQRIYNGPRQAADEVLAAVRVDHPGATMRRLSPKVYRIAVED